ncbi:MAG: response regulator [Brevinematia bacterium]
MNKTRPSIVIIEDEQFIARDMEETLKSFNYDVVGSYERGEDLLDELNSGNKKNISIAITDIYLKGRIDGIKLAKKLFEMRIPSIFVTAYTDEKTMKKALSFPVFGFLEKPFDPFSLRISIEIALNLFSMHSELEEKISFLSKEQSKLMRDVENNKKQLVEEAKLRKNLISENERLSREIVSFQYYVDVLKNEMGTVLLEKEKLQTVKSEIFEHLATYAKGMEFFNNLFCGIFEREEDFKTLFRLTIDDFKKVFDEDCKGVLLYIEDLKITTTEFIVTDFVYRYNFGNIDIEIFFNTENSLKKYITDSSKGLIELVLKIIHCFHNNKKLLLCEMEEKKILNDLFNSMAFPVIYYGKNRIFINEFAKEYLNVFSAKEIKEKILVDFEELERLSKEFLLDGKKKFFEYSCKVKGKDGIFKVRRSLFRDKTDEYVDVFSVES